MRVDRHAPRITRETEQPPERNRPARTVSREALARHDSQFEVARAEPKRPPAAKQVALAVAKVWTPKAKAVAAPALQSAAASIGAASRAVESAVMALGKGKPASFAARLGVAQS